MPQQGPPNPRFASYVRYAPFSVSLCISVSLTRSVPLSLSRSLSIAGGALCTLKLCVGRGEQKIRQNRGVRRSRWITGKAGHRAAVTLLTGDDWCSVYRLVAAVLVMLVIVYIYLYMYTYICQTCECNSGVRIPLPFPVL